MICSVFHIRVLSLILEELVPRGGQQMLRIKVIHLYMVILLFSVFELFICNLLFLNPAEP